MAALFYPDMALSVDLGLKLIASVIIYDGNGSAVGRRDLLRRTFRDQDGAEYQLTSPMWSREDQRLLQDSLVQNIRAGRMHPANVRQWCTEIHFLEVTTEVHGWTEEYGRARWGAMLARLRQSNPRYVSEATTFAPDIRLFIGLPCLVEPQ